MSMLVVLDTNVVISGTFWKGLPKRVLSLARSGEVSAVTSRVLMYELRQVLTRDKSPFHLTFDEADKIIRELLGFMDLQDPTRTVRICRDANDNHVLELAASVKAKYIVTADPDLLVLVQFETTKIVTVAEFLDLIEM